MVAWALLGWCWRGWQGHLVQDEMGKSVIFGGLGERGDGVPKGGEGKCVGEVGAAGGGGQGDGWGGLCGTRWSCSSCPSPVVCP